MAEQAGRPVQVGDLVLVPNLLPDDHPGHASAERMYAKPGRVIYVDQDWAVVDLGQWGNIGRPANTLVPLPDGATVTDARPWFADNYPDAHDWQPAGEHRWTARQPGPSGDDLWLYARADGSRHVVATVATGDVRAAYEAVDVEAVIWTPLGDILAEHALPGCAVPGCHDKGRLALPVQGPPAGQQWRPTLRMGFRMPNLTEPPAGLRAGDQIRLCHVHYEDVLRTHHTGQLTGSLRDDARKGKR